MYECSYLLLLETSNTFPEKKKQNQQDPDKSFH